MPKKSNKGYDPVNIDNLEQAIKLWRELNAMHSDATKYVEQYDKYMSKIDTLVGKQRDGNHRRLDDLEDELRHYRNIAQEQANIEKIKERELAIEREQKELAKERARQAKEQEKINKQNEATIRRLNNYNKSNSTPKGAQQLGWGNFGEYMTTNSSSYKNEYNRVYNHVYENVLSREKKAAAKEGRAIDYSYVQNQTNDGVAKSLEKSGFTKKMNTSAKIFQIAADTFKSAVDTIWKTFMAGSNNQLNAYESSFENISVRNRTTRSQYYNTQNNVNDILTNMGLNNNIRTSDVQNMWNTFANNGMAVDMSTEKAKAEITSKAIETILTNKIVPYLDVSSRSAQVIIDKNENFMKQIRGIGITTNELYGNSSFVTEHLQELVDDVAPMASLAEQELGLQFAQSSGEYAKMAAAGYTDAEIGEYYKNAAAIYRNPYQALKSGSLDQRTAVSRILSSGGDLSNWATVNTEAIKAANEYSNMVPEDNNATLYAGLLASKNIIGISALTSARTNKLNLSNDEIEAAGIKTAQETTAAGERATSDYKNDRNQTKRTLQETWLENASNELTTIREQLGIWEAPITTLLKGIGSLLSLWIGSKLIGGIFGKGGATFLSGVGSAVLGTIGPALGVGAAVVGVGAAVNGIYDKIVNGDNDNEANANEAYREAIKQGKTEEEALKIQADEWLTTATTKHETASGALREGITNANASDNWWDKTVGNTGRGIGLLFTASAQGIGDWVSRWGKSGTELSAQNFKNFNNVLDTKGVHDVEDRKWQVLSWLLLAYAATQDESNLKAVGVSKSMLAEYLKGMDKQKFLDTFEGTYIQGDYYAPQTPEGKAYTKLTSGDMNWLMNEFNIHRQGLGYVPYDNYPAMLHEGEAVLTASTANELRNLLDEYRQTSTQSVNFDSIIQQQTSDLIYKMDEIISAIGGVNVNTANYNENQGKTILRNSLSKIKSTKSF